MNDAPLEVELVPVAPQRRGCVTDTPSNPKQERDRRCDELLNARSSTVFITPNSASHTPKLKSADVT